MLNPFISNYVKIQNVGSGKFIAIANELIPDSVIVEICPVQILTKREAIILIKNIPSLQSAIFIDQNILSKEAKILTQLGELDLEGRLTRGEITADEFNKLLITNLNPDALLNAQSHVFVLGNGSLYQISESPNLVCEYHAKDKVCIFKSVQPINRGSELTYFK